MAYSPRRGFIDTMLFRRERGADRKHTMRLRPLIESLETRTVPSTIMWNTAVAPTGGGWDTAGNWQGGVIPGPGDNAVIDLTSSGTVTHATSANDSVLSLTTTNASLSLTSGSITLGSGSSSIGSVTVGIGATLSVGSGAHFTIQAGKTITDNGTLGFATGDTVTFALGSSFGAGLTTEIVVNGGFTATGTSFVQSGTASGAVGTILVNTGSTIQSGSLTNNIFNLPISVPAADVPLLASNQSFQQVDIDSGTLSSGTVNINLIGTVSTSNLEYVFPANFTVGIGATLSFGPNIPVVIQPGVTITDGGTLGFGSGDTVSLGAGQW